MITEFHPTASPEMQAILVVSFGTSYAETRAKTIDATETRIAEAFPGYDIRRAFTSKMIIKVLRERDNMNVDTPEEALKKLYEEGYSKVIVQPLHIINGSEYHDTVVVCHKYRKGFEKFSMGTALLNSTADYKQVAEIFVKHGPELNDGEALLLMGHGSVHSANAAYPALDFTFKQMGHEHVHVGTVEGYPELPEVMEMIASKKYSKIYMMPLMLVAGDHAQNDMASDEEDSWKTILEQRGYETEPILIGMGEMPEIQDLYVAHLYQAMAESND